MNNWEAKEETAHRLQFGIKSVQSVIKEKLSEGFVANSVSSISRPNAYEKLEEEEVDQIRKIIHMEMQNCDVKRLTPENEKITYPTLDSLRKTVIETGKFPDWSLTTFRRILLGMDIKFKAKSEVDKSIIIEDSYIEQWREKYLKNLEYYRSLGRPVFWTDETYIDPNAQPTRLLIDGTIKSGIDAKDKGASGLKWNAGRGNGLLVLHIIGDEGLVSGAERIWIHKNGESMSADYHDDIDSETFFNWFKDCLPSLPDNAVVVMDNSSIHNKRPKGTPKSSTRKGEMQNWLLKNNIEIY